MIDMKTLNYDLVHMCNLPPFKLLIFLFPSPIYPLSKPIKLIKAAQKQQKDSFRKQTLSK